MYNKWAPKRLHFSYQGMVARSQLAVIDFNLGAGLEQAETSSGEKRIKQNFSKMTKSWEVKPIKQVKNREIFQSMVERTLEVFLSEEKLPVPAIPDLPENIASIEKPSKTDAITQRRSRFI